MQPFITERDFPVNAAKKFKHHLDPALIPFFKQHYPLYTAVVLLNAVAQLTALRAMLSAAQAAKESWQNISNAALAAINAQGFMMTLMASAQADASQAEKTINAYRRAEIICFGCGEKNICGLRSKMTALTL
jgi:hypothetical protein